MVREIYFSNILKKRQLYFLLQGMFETDPVAKDNYLLQLKTVADNVYTYEFLDVLYLMVH